MPESKRKLVGAHLSDRGQFLAQGRQIHRPSPVVDLNRIPPAQANRNTIQAVEMTTRPLAAGRTVGVPLRQLHLADGP